MKDDLLKDWKWPFLRFSFNGHKEYMCPCGVGHSQGVHGCCGCCSHESFIKCLEKEKEKNEE